MTLAEHQQNYASLEINAGRDDVRKLADIWPELAEVREDKYFFVTSPDHDEQVLQFEGNRVLAFNANLNDFMQIAELV